MNKEFIPYEQALELKELGFDEPCFTESNHKKKCEQHEQPGGCSLPNVHCGYPNCTIDKTVKSVPLPLYQQAFRWFREKYKLHSHISLGISDEQDRSGLEYDEYIYVIEGLNGLDYDNYGESLFYKTPEEAELACLKQLIEIIKNK
jgi:hypothetical protein